MSEENFLKEEIKIEKENIEYHTNILVLGSGNFGTCLSYHLASEKLKNNVTIYSRNKEVVDSINNENTNPIYLKNYKLPNKIKATTELNEELLEKTKVIFD
jgi:glycerol-3-phosphate dehydrogenase (NAD(P)+)